MGLPAVVVVAVVVVVVVVVVVGLLLVVRSSCIWAPSWQQQVDEAEAEESPLL